MDSKFDADAFLAVAGDAVIGVDRQGVFVVWNRAAERLFGYPAEAAIGESLDLIIPERSRAAHWQGFRQAIASGQTRLGEGLIRVPALCSDGREIRVALSVGVVRDERRQIAALGAIIREDSAPRAVG